MISKRILTNREKEEFKQVIKELGFTIETWCNASGFNYGTIRQYVKNKDSRKINAEFYMTLVRIGVIDES